MPRLDHRGRASPAVLLQGSGQGGLPGWHQTHGHGHAGSPGIMASLGCGRKLHRLPAQLVPRDAGADGCQVKISCFLILQGHCTPPVVGFILGHEPVGLGLLQAEICQAALSAPACRCPSSPHSRRGRAGHPQARVRASLRCQQKSESVCSFLDANPPR